MKSESGFRRAWLLPASKKRNEAEAALEGDCFVLLILWYSRADFQK
ncbi:hypothetical protein ACFL96_01735 [Thermoproteota archaeon]